MPSVKQLASWLWLLGFRIGCIGLIVMGALASLAFAVPFVLRLVKPASLPDMPAPIGAFIAVMAALFVVIGIKGLRIMSSTDATAEIAALGSQRDKFERWINK
jgi:hypothetical protein